MDRPSLAVHLAFCLLGCPAPECTTGIADSCCSLPVRSQSGLIQLRPKFFWLGDRRLAGKLAAHVGCGLPVHQSTILQEGHNGGLPAGRSQGHYLEGPVATANHIQQSLGVSGVRLADDDNLLRL